MRKVVSTIFAVFVISLLISGCNIVPKSVQYQREEEKLIGNIDIINPIIEEIQVVLNSLGYETGSIDGRMGKKTRDSIKEFQSSLGIKTTGYINKLTLTQIEDAMRAKDRKELDTTHNIEVRSPYSKKGDYRPTAKDIQTALKNAGFDAGSIDGKMGPKTRQAIKEFQRTKGLKVDGVVGQQTWRALGKYIKK